MVWKRELRLHSSGLLTASVAPPALVAAAAVFNVQSVVYFVCWLNKCVVFYDKHNVLEVVAQFDPLVPRTVRSTYYFWHRTHFPLVDNMQPTDEGPIEKPIINWKGGSHMNPAQVHAHGPLNINK